MSGAQDADSSIGQIDHAGIIRDWNEESLARGAKIFASACATCHGIDGNTTALPTARAFGRDPFKFGSDPYSMWTTITNGAGMMLSQSWLLAEERYDIVHFIRETLVKPTNPDQYTALTKKYLNGLPKGLRKKSKALDGHPRDYGPVLASQMERRINSALTVTLSPDIRMTYDLHRMMVTDTWQGYLNLSATQHIRLRGEGQPRPDGTPLTGLDTWYWAYEDGLDPPEQVIQPRGIDGSHAMGPLPTDQLDYHGHYLYADRVALSYAVLGRNVLESPGLYRDDDFIVLTHTLRIEPGRTPLKLCAGSFAGDGWPMDGVYPLYGKIPSTAMGNSGGTVAIAGAEAVQGEEIAEFVAAALVGQTDGFWWEIDEQRRIGLHISPYSIPRTVQVLRFAGKGGGDFERFARFVDQLSQQGELTLPDLDAFTRGGPRRWRDTLPVQGTLAIDSTRYDPIDYENKDRIELAKQKNKVLMQPAYALDSLPLPVQNPWNSWMRPTALDFYSDGRLALATYGGDIWILSGIDATLKNLSWQRFASGLFEPMGIKIVDDRMYVTCRDRITLLHDFNEDGEADFYESFYADPDISNGFHGFNFDLQTDSEGNFYYVKPGLFTDYQRPGALIKLSPDGSHAEVVCTGFRVPNGMAIGPDDSIYVTDNQGSWIPAGKINRVRPGGFYGTFQSRDFQRDTFDQPMIWMPQEFDNSITSPLWVLDERWGPLAGKMIHTSFGKGWMYYHMIQEIGDVVQSAAIALPFQFDSGLMRSRVNPADGQVYTVGLTGWDTESTTADGCLNRVRYTGEEAYLLMDLKVRAGGIEMRFSVPLDRADAENLDSYSIEQWNYRWLPRYGSEHWSVENPEETGHDTVDIASARISDDARSVFLSIPDIRPVQQMRIRFQLNAADGTPMRDGTYLTIHKVPE